mgnify:CR=1 FL=1
MTMRSTVGAVLVALALMGGAAGQDGTNPEASECKSDEVPVPDERDGAKSLCLSKSEWDRAKEICDALEPGSDPLECTCQDGDHVGACGD